MSFSIKITQRAEKSYRQNLDYLNENWGPKVTIAFIDRVDSIGKSISKNPYLYPLFLRSQNIRRCVVHERIIMYYRISGKTKITILLFWNTYQKPEKLKL